MRPRTTVLLTLLVLLAAVPALARNPEINRTAFRQVAIEGYDPVAYFEDGEPKEGSAEHEHVWKHATWRFTSAEHRDAFVAEPEKYAPQYGGYCAYAVAKDRLAKGDPEVWVIRDGKLYLNYDVEIKQRWLADVERYVEQADEHWPGVLD